MIPMGQTKSQSPTEDDESRFADRRLRAAPVLRLFQGRGRWHSGRRTTRQPGFAGVPLRVLSLAILLSALPAFGQPYEDTITVNVVDVPVYVERFGGPVTGLTRDDFELFVNGRPHPIEYFDVIEEGSVELDSSAGSPSPVDLKRRRLIVLLFDVDSPPWLLRHARDGAAAYVESGSPGDTFAVATVSPSGVLFLVPFTKDRKAVLRAIATLRPSAARDPFRVALLDGERTWGGGGGADAGRGAIGDLWSGRHPATALPPAMAGRFGGAGIDLDRTLDDYGSRGLIENLIALAERLAPLEGRKEVVLMSEGHGDPLAGAPGGGGVLAAIMDLHERYRAAGVFLNAVDIRGLRAPGGDAGSLARSGVGGPPDIRTSSFLSALALDTGGIAASSISHIRKRQGMVYVIGFRPPPSPSSDNSIRIRVKHQPFLTETRYRKAYTLERETKDEGLFLADTLLNDIPQNGVTLSLDVDGTSVAASIPGVELLALNRTPVRLDVYMYVFDERNHAVAWNRLRLAVDVDKGREFLSANAYTMRREFVLDPGRYVAKVVARIEGTDRVGFARAGFEVSR